MLNIYDFDKTIYKGDSTIDFYKFCINKNKFILLFMPFQLFNFFLFKITRNVKYKEKFFVFLKKININEYVKEFWDKNEYKIKDFYKKKKHKNDIIISASPYFLINEIGIRLKVMDVIATNVNELGKIIGNNCYGEEKVKMFMSKYKDYKVNEVYSDSLSDIPIFKLGKKKFLIKNDSIRRYYEK